MIVPFIHFGNRDWTIYVSKAGLRTRPGRVHPGDMQADPDFPHRASLRRYPIFQEIVPNIYEREIYQRAASLGLCVLVPPSRRDTVVRSLYQIALN